MNNELRMYELITTSCSIGEIRESVIALSEQSFNNKIMDPGRGNYGDGTPGGH